MRLTVRLLYVCLLLISGLTQTGSAQDYLNNPESVVYDATYNRYLISNTGNGDIIQITDAGDTSVFITPSTSCRGILIIGGAFFVVGDHGVSMHALATGGTAWTLAIPGMQFLNDITTDGAGYLYITDWERDWIYKVKISDHSYSTFVSSGLSYPNGIAYDSDNNRLLLVSSANHVPIQAVSLADSTVSTVIDPGFYGLDGIVKDDEGNWYVSEWPTNSIFRFEPSFSEPPVVVSSGHDGPADICFNSEHDILAVPNYNSHTVDFVHLTIGQFTRIYDPVITAGSESAWGCAWVDIDNDGWLDLYRAQLGRSCQIFHNDGGTGFTEVTSNGLVDNYFGDHEINGSWADYDNDGDVDVFIASFKEPSGAVNYLYSNDGDGTFTRITSGIHVNELSMSISPSWVDFNNDGLLDLSVASHMAGNFLYRQDDTGFAKITSGDIVTIEGGSNCASWCDFDGNGFSDVHYANFFETLVNQCYLNNGDETFTSATGHVVTDARHSLGGVWGDYDNDGDFDLFVTDGIEAYPDFLYENQGGGILVPVTDSLFVNTLRVSNGAAWGDFDNDGDLDLYVVTGGTNNRNLYYENLGGGAFVLATVNEVVTDRDNSMGITCGDYDRDGDLDIYSTYYGAGNGALYRNNGNGNGWISIQCIGTNSNRSAIGTKVRILSTIDGNSTWQLRQISAQTTYCGQNSLNVHFGLGDAISIDSLIIEWPSGMIDIDTAVSPNQFIAYTESLCGDANGDVSVNIGDAVFLINHIFQGGPPPEPLAVGDTNGDGAINIGDAVYLIVYIFRQGPPPQC
ncbi:MAG: FG-GAP-like repeat-containing protein [Candidatus Zixiibacteriota bacterium]